MGTTPHSPSPSPTDPAQRWIGSWTGQMVVTSIDYPEMYSDTQRAELLNTQYPMVFIIKMDEQGQLYLVPDDSASSKNTPSEITLTVEDRTITITTKYASNDTGDSYQIFTGELQENDKTIAGTYNVGIESIGQFYSGTWSVDAID